MLTDELRNLASMLEEYAEKLDNIATIWGKLEDLTETLGGIRDDLEGAIDECEEIAMEAEDTNNYITRE